MNEFRNLLRIVFVLGLVVPMVLGPRIEAASPKVRKYGTRVSAPAGRRVAFPDFQLRYLGIRAVSPEAKSRNPSAAIQEDADPRALLELKGFLVEAEGEPIYGGVFLASDSSAAVHVPTIAAEQADGKLVLRIRRADACMSLIEDRRLETLFRQLGKLRPGKTS
jgi:hypothetical protein